MGGFTNMTIVLQFFPNGEFTKGVNTAPRRKERRDKQRRHDELTRECKEGYLEWVRSTPNSDSPLCVPGQQFTNQRGELYTYLCEDVNGHHYALEGENFVLPDVLMNEPIGRLVARGELTPLVHQTVESSAPPETRSRKQCEKLSSRLARRIRNAGYILEQWYGKDNLSFLTLTLPALSTEDLAKCCENWGKMVDNFIHSMKKRLKRKGVEFHYVYCAEIQPNRLTTRGEYAPHLHMCFRGRSGKKKPWYVTPRQVRAAWTACISNVVGHREFDNRALENLQRVRKSCARYLAKYLSKGNCCLPESLAETAVGRLKTQWGGMARILSNAIDLYIERITSEGDNRDLAICIVRGMDVLLEKRLVSWWRSAFINLSYGDSPGNERGIWVGCGCLATPTYEGGLTRIRQFFEGYVGDISIIVKQPLTDV